GRAWAVASETPADSKQGCASREPQINITSARNRKRPGPERLRAPFHPQIGRKMYGDSPYHHQGEARVPIAQKVQKSDDFLRTRHAGDDQPERKQKATQEISERLHSTPPNKDFTR